MADRYGSSREKFYRSRNRALAALVQSTTNVVTTDIDGLDSARTIALINNTATGLDSAQVLSIAGNAGLDSAAVLSIALSGYGERKTFIQSSAPTDGFQQGDFWWDRDGNTLYKATASTAITSYPLPAGSTSQYPGLALDARGNHLTKSPGYTSANFTFYGITQSYANTGVFATHGGTYPWEPFDASNTGVKYTLTTPTLFYAFSTGNTDAGWIYKIEYEDGSYAISNNANPVQEPTSLSWFDANGNSLNKTTSFGNGTRILTHPSGVKCSAFVIARGSYGTRSYDFWVFFQGADYWKPVGDMYLDSDGVRSYVTADHINSLGISAGLDSAAVTSLIDSSYINARIGAGTVEAIVDSAYIQARQSNVGGGVDSAATISLIGDIDRRFNIQTTSPSEITVGDFWLKRDTHDWYELQASNTYTTTKPTTTFTAYPGLTQVDWLAQSSTATRAFNIAGGPTGTFTATFGMGYYPYNSGGQYTFANPVNISYWYSATLYAGWIYKIEYDNGDYMISNDANPNGTPGTYTWYNSSDVAIGKSISASNGLLDIRHPTGEFATSFVIGCAWHGATEPTYMFFSGSNSWNKIGEIYDSAGIKSLIDSSYISSLTLNTVTLGDHQIKDSNNSLFFTYSDTNTNIMKLDSDGSITVTGAVSAASATVTGAVTVSDTGFNSVLNLHNTGSGGSNFSLFSTMSSFSQGANTFMLYSPSATDGIIKATVNGYVTMPYQPGFTVYTTAPTSAGNTVQFGGVSFNTGNHFNTSTGVFTAPVAGKYWFYWHLLTDRTTAVGEGYLDVYKNGAYHYRNFEFKGNTVSFHVEYKGGQIVDMSAGDTIHLEFVAGSIGGNIISNFHHSKFSGMLLS